MMPIDPDQPTMWTLSTGRKAVRLALPPLRIEGTPEPIKVYMDFDAEAVDEV
jgi:hypothetical protein